VLATAAPKDFKLPDHEAAREEFAKASDLAAIAHAVADVLEGQQFTSLPTELREAANEVVIALFHAARVKPA